MSPLREHRDNSVGQRGGRQARWVDRLDGTAAGP
jgi:hypothetical protein